MDKQYLATTAIAAAIMLALGSRSTAAPAGYVPGLGEFMSATQMRHAKLWFAGLARNWTLAAYELDEIKEGLRDIARFDPTHPGSPVPVRELLPKLMAPPLAGLRVAINSRNPKKFDEAFDALTASCNACHHAENVGFIVITRPIGNPYTNQDFAPASTPSRLP